MDDLRTKYETYTEKYGAEEAKRLIGSAAVQRLGLTPRLPDALLPSQQPKMATAVVAPVQRAMTRCSCGHTVPSSVVMTASRGTACPDCYDDMSD